MKRTRGVPSLKQVYNPPVARKISKKLNKGVGKGINPALANGGFPTLTTLMKKIPKGGLLNPGLRKGGMGLDLKKIGKSVCR